MISESCDTEDWSNDAENSAAHHKNKFNFKEVIWCDFKFSFLFGVYKLFVHR